MCRLESDIKSLKSKENDDDDEHKEKPKIQKSKIEEKRVKKSVDVVPSVDIEPKKTRFGRVVKPKKKLDL